MISIIPDVKLTDASETERALWEKLTLSERKKLFYSFEHIVPKEK
jgi:hypothetical protein